MFLLCLLFNDDDEVLDVEVDSNFDNIVVVDNLPKVEEDKFKKLKSFLWKILSVTKEDIFFIPCDSDTGQTLGYCFIEYHTPQV